MRFSERRFKSRRLLGFIIGLSAGAIQIASALVMKSIPSNWFTDFISRLNIPAALLTLVFYHLFDLSQTLFNGVFYGLLAVQWAAVGFVIGWILDWRALRQTRSDTPAPR
jgi:hypothetical protein